MDEPIDDFDAEKAVANYRRVIARRDEETTRDGKADFDATSKRMRHAWKNWQGEDSLHEMAFGEPEE
jgi:hypothetical protein